MKVLFVNPPNTTALHATEPLRYVEENVGVNYFIVPRIPFQVMAGINTSDKGIVLLDFEWYKQPNLTKEQLIKIALERKPDVVLTTLISTSNADSIDYLTTQIKECSPKTKIILGGQGVEILKEKTFKFVPNIDAAVLSGSRRALTSVLERVVSGEPMSRLVHEQDMVEEVYSPDLMYEPFKALMRDIVISVRDRGAKPIGLLENYKGCPFPCDFCAAKKPVTKRTINSTLEEMAYLYDLGIPKFYFVDLTFGLNRKESEELLSRLTEFKEQHSEFGFRCVTRASIIDKDLADQMKGAGCYEVGIGVETGDDSVLRIMNKKSSKEVNWQALDSLGRAGITSKLFLIEGYNGSSSKGSLETFNLLNQIGNRGYSFFVQPALNRDIMPHQSGFKTREDASVLRRGVMHQLDFRHDGRDFGWDEDRAIRAMCYLMLAYPSTEISQTHSDTGLQQRATMDLPFLVSRLTFSEALSFANSCIQRDVVHYLEGVYTLEEITQRIEKSRGNQPTTASEVEEIVEKLRDAGLVDSFGNPNLKARPIDRRQLLEEASGNPQTSLDLLLFWDGKNQRYAYLPRGVKNMKASFYQEIPEDAFEYLFLAKGVHTPKEIGERMHRIFRENENYKSEEASVKTTGKIRTVYQKNGFLICWPKKATIL